MSLNVCRLAEHCENYQNKKGLCLTVDKCYSPKGSVTFIDEENPNMSLSKKYHKETGLHSHYLSKQGSHKKGKKGLVYTRRYVWWLENKIKTLKEEIEKT